MTAQLSILGAYFGRTAFTAFAAWQFGLSFAGSVEYRRGRPILRLIRMAQKPEFSNRSNRATESVEGQ